MNNVRRVQDAYVAAGAPDATVDRMKRLARSEVAAVRRRVAENAQTPVHVLALLAQDPNPQVRIGVGLNRATPYVVLSHLACDHDPDVRYCLANTSYLPTRLLFEGIADPNPAVSRRAARTSLLVQAGLSQDKLSIVEFLGQDHCLFVARLEKLLGHHSHCSKPHSFEHTIEAIDCINSHFTRQHKLCTEHTSTGNWLSQDLLRKAASDHRQIDEKIESLIVLHTQGAQDLCIPLYQLLKLVLKHIDFAEQELFVELRRQLSSKGVNDMNGHAQRALLTKAL